MKYSSLDELRAYVNNSSDVSQNLLNICVHIVDEEWQLIESSFLRMWLDNEYLQDCYNTNKTLHF